MHLIAFAFSLMPSLAHAQTAMDQASPWASMLPLVLIFFVFYFLLIRPQQRRFKQHQTMLDALKKGDQVITGGGIAGKIVGIDGDMATVEIAQGVQVKAIKSSISTVMSKADGTPVVDKKKDKQSSMVKNDNVVLNKEDIANDN